MGYAIDVSDLSASGIDVPRYIDTSWGTTKPHNYAAGSAPVGPVSFAPIAIHVRPPASLPLDVSGRFGRRLRELRVERNMTQSYMAKKFGIDRSFLSDVERGRKSISLAMLEVIALGMRVSLSELFKTV
jgi:DNA-binding XRE family transcriptional regulator